MTSLAAVEAYSTPKKLPRTESLRLARLLSLKVGPDFDDLKLSNRIAAGLRPKSLGTVTLVFGESGEVAMIPEATLRRAIKNGKRLSKQHSETVYEMSLVLDSVSRLYRGDVENIRRFMLKEHPLLDGQSPFDVTRSTSAGARTVLKLLQQIEAGVSL